MLENMIKATSHNKCKANPRYCKAGYMTCMVMHSLIVKFVFEELKYEIHSPRQCSHTKTISDSCQ